MSMTDMSQKDRFWQRVRLILSRAPGGRAPDGAVALRSLGKTLPPVRMVEELQRGWLLAAERQVSLCVMALEVDCFGEYLAVYGREAADDCLERLHQVISALLERDDDRCLRLGQSGFLMILPDMPMLMARDLANGIGRAVRQQGLINKESHAGTVTLGAGLAVINPPPAFDDAVLDIARDALRKAQRRGLGRLEIADLRAPDLRRDVAA